MITVIIEELKKGNHKIVDMFFELDKLWSDVLYDIRDSSIDTIADRLNDSQDKVEQICNSRYIGKMIMPWSAFAHLYSCQVGYEDNGPSAFKLSQAFENSMCSLEVKSGAKEAAKVYHVADYA